MSNKQIMQKAIYQARQAYEANEVPVGAVICHAKTGEIIASAHNLVEKCQDPTMHAELIAIREACSLLNQKWLSDYVLYVTLEPCAMCASAISHARLKAVYFGAYDPKSGGVEHGACVFQHQTCHYKPEAVGGILEQECSELLQHFFQQKRTIS